MDYKPICYACNKVIKENKEPFYYCVQRNHCVRTDQELEKDPILDGLELLALCTKRIYRAMSVNFHSIYEPIEMLELEKRELTRFANWYTNGIGKLMPVNDSQVIYSICQKPIPLLDEYTRTEISVDVLLKDDEVRSEENYVLAVFCYDCSNSYLEIVDLPLERDSDTF